MRRGLAAFALFAGCSFDHGQPVDHGPQDAPRIDTQMIDAQVIDSSTVDTMTVTIDAAIDAASPTDTDADGVPDTTDNCPTAANANQRDHDSDGHGDVCDRCPHLPSTADPDGDGDGVGDDCDPRPATAGDSRALFEGFYDANSINGWAETGNGVWTVANGVLSQASTTASTNTNTLAAPGTITRAAITAGVRVIGLGNPQGNLDTPHVSVATGVTSSQSYWCSVVHEDNGNKLYASIFRTAMIPQFPNSPWAGTFMANSELRITSALLGNNDECTVVQGTTIGTATGTIGATTGAVQVATRTAAASFDYVFVVSIGP